MTLAVLLTYALFGIFVLIVLPGLIYWMVVSALRWPARIRHVLAQEGFTVRHLERRWLTRGPFPDMRLPGTKGATEWLIRFVAEGRDHQPRGGWIRWHSRLPWQAADRWAIHWDQLPASGVWDGAAASESKGVSSRVFYAVLVGLGAVVVMVVLTIWRFDLGFQIRAAAAQESSAAAAANIPLCPGLTIVTAISQPQGDYESIKRIESVTAAGARIRYSSYMPDPNGDYDSTTVAPPPWVPFVVRRTVRTADLDASATYLQQFAPEGVPETVNGTTALGISRKSFRELKSTGKILLTIYQAINPSFGVKEDGTPVVSAIDSRLPGELARVDPNPVPVSLLVNDRMTTLPAIRARGKFLWDDSEFFFLDDERNPITLKFRIGIAAPPPGADALKQIEQHPDLKKMLDQPGVREVMQKQQRDRDVLQVLKITTGCEDPSLTLAAGGRGAKPPAGGGAGGDSGATAIEESLAKTGRADIYSIYFAFNSDEIREESESTLREIAEVLRRHPEWKLAIEGHTDNIATDAYNLQLSQRRSAAVKQALVSGKGVATARLTTGEFGEARPKDTNDTLEGRARNRRVELVRVP